MVLKHIPKNISADLLKALMEMGHGDEIVLADANYPAATNAKRLIRCDGLQIPDLLQSVLELFPLDTYSTSSVFLMDTVEGDPTPNIWSAYKNILVDSGNAAHSISYLSREDFYRQSREAYAIVATGETALYGNILLKKGVVTEE